jgi:FtsP/CotA-like multicopper oxidase with cupredoxin domain
MRIKALTLTLLLGVGLVACETEPADQPPAADPGEAPAPAELATPDWFVVDHDAETVHIELVAGTTSANSYWNFQGFHGGEGEIVVPEGYEVTVNLVNQDPAMAHSVGVGELRANYPSTFDDVQPIFEGAVTSNPTSMTESTLPGESESITFTVDQAGEFALICYVTGHASAGMWMPFTVSAEGDAGVRN